MGRMTVNTHYAVPGMQTGGPKGSMVAWQHGNITALQQGSRFIAHGCIGGKQHGCIGGADEQQNTRQVHACL